ncbi:MAG: porin [Planctomycetota bacterium]
MMSCFVPGGASRLKNVQTYRWNRFLGLALLWLSPLAIHAQSPLLEQPIGDTPQLTPVQNEVPVEPESGGLIVPTPADPKSVFATQDDLFRQNLRIMELEQHLSQVQTETQKGLQEGRLRSTDIPLIEGLRKASAFPKVKLTGFFQADAGFFQQDAQSLANYGDIGDNRGFRRARLAAVGDVSEYVSYMLEMDFAFPGRPTFMDVWVDVHNVPLLGNVRVGQYRMPFGMDALTSVRELTFLERASPFAFNPFRQIGAGFHDNNQDETVTWAASVFGFPTDPWGGNTGDNGYGMAGRITALPIYADDGSFLVHMGFDYSLTRPSTKTLEYRNTPEYGGPFVGPTGTQASVPFFVDTGAMSATTSNLLNAELAAVWNQSYIQSELTYALVNLTNGSTATLPGYYAQAGYFLTGEQRSYNKIAGVLGRVKPLHNWGEPCGYGAVELAARYSYLDLNSHGINGGRMNDVTLGTNWYLNQYTKLQLNYIRSIVDKGVDDNINTNIVAIRAQLDF